MLGFSFLDKSLLLHQPLVHPFTHHEAVHTNVETKACLEELQLNTGDQRCSILHSKNGITY